MGDGEKLLTYLNSALKVLLGLDIFPRVPKKKLNFVDQCNQLLSQPMVLMTALSLSHYNLPQATRWDTSNSSYIKILSNVPLFT